MTICAEDFDGIMLDDFKKALRDKVSKKFIVVHMRGSHFDYSKRYPENFSAFKPNLYAYNNVDINDFSKKEEFINSYDNSILYTDYFIDRLIGMVDKEHIVSSIIFISDHGENLFDDDNHLSGHGRGAVQEVFVPLLVWYSQAYQAFFPEKVLALEINKSKSVSADNVFHSLADMAGITYIEQQEEMSVFSDKYVEHDRLFILPNDDVVDVKQYFYH